MSRKNVYVFADWEELSEPALVGILSADRVRGKDFYSFSYDKSWLVS